MTNTENKEPCGCVEVGTGKYPKYCPTHLAESVSKTKEPWRSAFREQFVSTDGALLTSWSVIHPDGIYPDDQHRMGDCPYYQVWIRGNQRKDQMFNSELNQICPMCFSWK